MSPKEAEAMRSQTQEYVFAVMLAHPELVRPEDMTFDPYPFKHGKLKKFSQLDPLDKILMEVAHETSVGVAMLKGRARQKHIVKARWLFFDRAYKAGYSLARTGRKLNRDHTTVIHGLTRMGVRTRGE